MNIKGNKFLQFLMNQKIILCIFILIGIIFAIQGLITYRYNNYLIFKYTWPHFIKQLPLYIQYPNEYFDSSHYGPVFSLLMAPFYVLPDWLGLPLFDITNAVIFWAALQTLPIKPENKVFIAWLSIPVFVNSALSEQFNPIAGAMIILSYTMIHRGSVGKSAFFIVLGTAIKLYGIVGLAFFFFTEKKKRFIGYLILWSVITFITPMLINSPHYVLQSYVQWIDALSTKNVENMGLNNLQNVSIMGLTDRIFMDAHIPNLPFLIVAVAAFMSVFIHKKRWYNLNLQLDLLSLTLITSILFSTSAEVVTYIICIAGAGIWFLQSTNIYWRNVVLSILIILLFVPFWSFLPVRVRDANLYIYSLMAIPYTLIWLSLLYRLHTGKYPKKQIY